MPKCGVKFQQKGEKLMLSAISCSSYKSFKKVDFAENMA